MDGSNHLDPNAVTGWLAALTAIVAFLTWPYRTFVTRKTADKVYLKRIEDDGTTQYVRAVDFKRLEDAVNESNEESRKWRGIAKDWMEHP